MEGGRKGTEPEGEGDGVEPESGRNMSSKIREGELAHDFDFKFAPLPQTPPRSVIRNFNPSVVRL